MEDRLCILVVDDDRMMARTIVDILKVKGYEAEAAYSGPEALEKLTEGSFGPLAGLRTSCAQDRPFDCILTDVKMPGANGVELYRAIKARQPDLPVVLMTAYSTDRLVEQGLEEGVIAVLTKPLDIGLLLTFFSFLRKERSIVIVDDDPQFCRTLGDILRVRGFVVTQVTDPRGVVEMVGVDGEVVLLDMKFDDISGLEVLQEIKEQHPCLPVILVTGYRAEMASAIEAALKVGACTCLYKPFEVKELVEVLTRVHHQELGRVLGRCA